MSESRLDQVCIAHPEVSRCLQTGQGAEGERVARENLATAMADLAVIQVQQGKVQEAVKTLQDALNLCPTNYRVFHNLVAVLMGHRELRGKNLDALSQFVVDHGRETAWVRDYQGLLVLPRFVNLEFVSGKCNLACRMCNGRNSPSYPNELTGMSAETFERLLAAMPTVGGLTLSGGDSDPLLHPELESMLDKAAAAKVPVDIFTNGHALTEPLCRKMVHRGAVNMINFSLDAATPETYRRIRGASLERVLGKIEMLNAMKAEANTIRPGLSLSFVAMADNIEELPEFVGMALRLKAWRVYVEYLNGWDDDQSGNLVPSRHERYHECVRAAQAAAEGTPLVLSLPDRMRAEMGLAGGADQAASGEAPGPGPEDSQLKCCGWLRGAFVQRDGTIEPCCLVQNVADMGHVDDGPLHQNAKYLRVKGLLLSGRVFKQCRDTRMCPYVQQRVAAGAPPELIDDATLTAHSVAPRERPAVRPAGPTRQRPAPKMCAAD